jgi:hypothetical protein
MRRLLLLVLLLGFGVFASTARADSVPLIAYTLSGSLESWNAINGFPIETSGFDSTIQWVGFSFVLGRPFKDVSITLNDIANFGTPGNGRGPLDLPGLAYLTNGIGIGATPQNTIATASFAQNWVLGTPLRPFVGSYTLFGNLDLGPGTYDFFLTVPYGGWALWGGFDAQQGAPTTTFYQAPGVGLMGGFLTQGSCLSTKGPYRPPIGCGSADIAVPAASVWNFSPGSPGFAGPFEIDGTAVLAAPEPSTWIYVLGAALLTLVIKWKTLFN